jgi:hypothetical protein
MSRDPLKDVIPEHLGRFLEEQCTDTMGIGGLGEPIDSFGMSRSAQRWPRLGSRDTSRPAAHPSKAAR